jgi:hypothetical protein
MGIRYRKGFKIFPGLRLNLNARSVSASPAAAAARMSRTTARATAPRLSAPRALGCPTGRREGYVARRRVPDPRGSRIGSTRSCWA